ncbi:MAG: hypothetical protein JNL10_00060, partial [Verrucomicrobiales bacterium]|nr:hypothetical protein [Verrucomicrobiales bacterium]
MTLLLLAMGVWGLDVAYTLRGNPELQFFRKAWEIKRAQARRLSGKPGGKVVLYGGSSSLFSINTGQLQSENGIPAVNFAFGAGFGASILTQAAVQEVASGDTLAVALEPVLLTDSLEPPAMGIQFAVVTGNPSWFSHPTVGRESVGWIPAALALRPGGYHVLTMLGKLGRSGPLYRYNITNIQADGFARTEVRVPVHEAAWHSGVLPKESGAFLESLRRWCESTGVRVYYVLPWSYCPQADLVRFQQLNARFLLQVIRYLPVLRDPRLGADPEALHFGDSGFHMTAESSRIRTAELASA